MPFVIGTGKVQAIAKDDAVLSLFCFGSARVVTLERESVALAVRSDG
jgi:hypothetical protein